MKIIGVYNPPFWVTVVGLFFALATCIFSFNNYFGLAVICFMFSGICDLFDGVIARKAHRSEDEKTFGLYIDSTVDIVSFGLTPVILLLHSGFNDLIDYFLFFLYCSCASIRLAWFNLQQRNNGKKMSCYIGLPVTYAALILPLVFTFGLLLDENGYKLLIRLVLLLIGLLFVLNVPIKKPGGIFYIIFPLMATFLTVFWVSRSLG